MSGKVRDDVVDDGVLEHRPVLPGRIVRMTSPDFPGISGFKCDKNRSAPSLDEADAPGALLRSGHGLAISAIRQLLHDLPHETDRFGDFVEPHGHPCGNISLRRTIFRSARSP